VTAQVVAGPSVDVAVALENRGSLAWAAAAPARPGVPYSVRLELAWVGSDPADGVPATYELRRDVPAGEALVQSLTIGAPRRPGLARLSVALRQVDGPELATGSVEHRVDVAEPR
jgi:hypothetical protein